MAIFACTACGYQGHYGEFKADTHEVFDEELGELIEEDTTECPECGHDGAVEL